MPDPNAGQTHTDPIDFHRPTRALQSAADGVSEEQLGDPTPCEGRTVGQLLGHLVGLTDAFRAAADKELGPLTDTDPDGNGWPDAEDGWREALAVRLPALAQAWADPAAWQGMTRAGGVDLPGEVAGLVALDEVVLHGWDLARATGQEFEVDEGTAQVLLEFVSQFDPDGTPGLFGAARTIATDAPPFDRVLARAGRDPGWSST